MLGRLTTTDIFEDCNENEFPGQRGCRRRFTQTLELIQDVIPSLRNTRWSNKTDFYSLFVATAHLLRDLVLPGDEILSLRESLTVFADNISKYQSEENASVEEDVKNYVEAHEAR